MTLTEFLAAQNIRQSDFAAEIGMSAAYVSLICRGRIWPSREVMHRIQAATGGEVTPNDFLRLTEAAQ